MLTKGPTGRTVRLRQRRRLTEPFDARPRGPAMIRAFVAIALPDTIRSALAVEQFLLPLPRRVEPDSFHMTLCFLGEIPDVILEAAHEGFSAIAMPAFPLTIAGLGLFGGARPRVAWAGAEGGAPLLRLQAKVERAARVAGAEPEARRFTPHVTLGRFPPPAPEERMRLERAIASGAGFQAGVFEVSAFTLFRSVRGAGGSRYEVLADYPLGRAGAQPA